MGSLNNEQIAVVSRDGYHIMSLRSSLLGYFWFVLHGVLEPELERRDTLVWSCLFCIQCHKKEDMIRRFIEFPCSDDSLSEFMKTDLT